MVSDFSGTDDPGPTGNHRYPNTTFKELLFAATERAVTIEEFEVAAAYPGWPIIAAEHHDCIVVDIKFHDQV